MFNVNLIIYNLISTLMPCCWATYRYTGIYYILTDDLYILQIALEAAQAYNREKPPHQTVGDTVMMALQYAAAQDRKQREAGKD